MFINSVSPFCAAMRRGVNPFLSLASRFAPFRIRKSDTSGYPAHIEVISGDVPSADLIFMSAP